MKYDRDEAIRKFYDNLSPVYESTLYTESTEPGAIYERYKVVFNKLGLSNLNRLLELGSGTGVFTIPIAQRTNGVIYCTDLSLKMLKRLDEKRRALDLRNIKNFCVCNFNPRVDIYLPFADAVFDSALFAFSLNEAADRVQTLGEVMRVLRQNGKVVIIDMEGGDAFVPSAGKTINDLMRDACCFKHRGYPNKLQWRQILIGAGFGSVEIQIIKRDEWSVLGHNFHINLCLVMGIKT